MITNKHCCDYRHQTVTVKFTKTRLSEFSLTPILLVRVETSTARGGRSLSDYKYKKKRETSEREGSGWEQEANKKKEKKKTCKA